MLDTEILPFVFGLYAVGGFFAAVGAAMIFGPGGAILAIGIWQMAPPLAAMASGVFR